MCVCVCGYVHNYISLQSLLEKEKHSGNVNVPACYHILIKTKQTGEKIFDDGKKKKKKVSQFFYKTLGKEGMTGHLLLSY